MLVKNCFVDMSVNMEIEKNGKVFAVTALPKVWSAFLKEDIFQYREDVNSLEIKLLTLENVDFNLNQSGKIVKQLLPHSDSQEHQTIVTTLMPQDKKGSDSRLSSLPCY